MYKFSKLIKYQCATLPSPMLLSTLYKISPFKRFNPTKPSSFIAKPQNKE